MDWLSQFTEMLFPVDRNNLNIEGAYVLKHKHLPELLFKYRKVNDCSLKNLEDDTVWLADPSNFNDPYDCSHTIDLALISQARSKEFLLYFFRKRGLDKELGSELERKILNSKDPIFEFIDHALRGEPREKRIAIKSGLQDAQRKMHEDMAFDSSKHISRSFKLCSFSERSDSILMWSHYANYHKGSPVNKLEFFKHWDKWYSSNQG